MYHPTQKELIRDALESQVGVLVGPPRVHEVSQYSPERWAELNEWYEAEFREYSSAGIGFRMVHLSFMNRYDKYNLEHWLKTGEYLPLTRISGLAVLNFLKTRNSEVDFVRDALDVVTENDNVVVRIVDKVSGGSSAHVTDLDPKTFENQYGTK